MCGAVSMGNPHCVIEVPSVADAPVETLGPIMERHERFPSGSTSASWRWSTPARSSCGSSSAGWGDPGLRDRGLCGRGDRHQPGQAQGGSPSPCRAAS